MCFDAGLLKLHQFFTFRFLDNDLCGRFATVVTGNHLQVLRCGRSDQWPLALEFMAIAAMSTLPASDAWPGTRGTRIKQSGGQHRVMRRFFKTFLKHDIMLIHVDSCCMFRVRVMFDFYPVVDVDVVAIWGPQISPEWQSSGWAFDNVIALLGSLYSRVSLARGKRRSSYGQFASLDGSTCHFLSARIFRISVHHGMPILITQRAAWKVIGW